MINRLFEGIILSQTEETKGKDESDMLLYRLIFQCPKDFVEKIRREEQDRMRSGCRYQGTMLSLNTKFENHYNNEELKWTKEAMMDREKLIDKIVAELPKKYRGIWEYDWWNAKVEVKEEDICW